jgi:hypothetical protein
MNSTALETAENADCPDSHAILGAGRRRKTNSTPRHRNAETGHEVEIFTNAMNEDAYSEFYSKVKINARRFDVLNNHNSPTEWAGFYANDATRQG